MLADPTSYPRRKLFLESLRCLVGAEDAKVFTKKQQPSHEQVHLQQLVSIDQPQPASQAADHKLFQADVSRIELEDSHDAEPTDPVLERKRELIEKIKKRLCTNQTNDHTHVKSLRPTTTCTLASPIRSRPSTQFSSCRTQTKSRASRRITEYLSRSPDNKKEAPEAELEAAPGQLFAPQQRTKTVDSRPSASQILRRLSYTNNISGCHNFLRKGSSVACKMMGNFIEQANNKLHRQLEESVQPYNEKFLRQYNQVIPAAFYEQLETNQLMKMARILKGPQPVTTTPNSAFFQHRLPLSKQNQQSQQSQPTKRSTAHSKSTSNLTLRTRGSRRADITGWDQA